MIMPAAWENVAELAEEASATRKEASSDRRPDLLEGFGGPDVPEKLTAAVQPQGFFPLFLPQQTNKSGKAKARAKEKEEAKGRGHAKDEVGLICFRQTCRNREIHHLEAQEVWERFCEAVYVGEEGDDAEKAPEGATEEPQDVEMPDTKGYRMLNAASTVLSLSTVLGPSCRR
ncbi:hypothetical protein AK812_SmicGene13096 [Symbiodinium microadriaticum]|uniref:Uncharacterized protein n=1 Tax=Symbiodinium microadriaticum TaxID=2951 RepID=A0A1Q9E924_SYMMI|nr:hypothetical protein AK812_SmicGene13096 [Symbiodinium microadriaticum]